MPTGNPSAISGDILEETADLTMSDLTQACSVPAETLVDLVNEGVIEPINPTSPRWRFTGTSLLRVRVVLNLQRDLDVNLAGAALALQLMDDIDRLEAELQRRPPGA